MSGLYSPILEQAGFLKRKADAEHLIKKLFANGEQGVWYDPSDLSTLFQDAAGTTPVTSDGDPVGLMLDKSQGLELGPEFIGESYTNNRFDSFTASGTGFTATKSTPGGTVWAISSNKITAIKGKLYEIEIDVTSLTDSFEVVFSHGTNKRTTSFYVNSTGVTKGFLIPNVHDIGEYSISVMNTHVQTIEVARISVRELHGNHATQSVSASRPTYRTDGTLHWLEFDGVDDYLISDTAVTKPPSVAFAIELTAVSDPPDGIVGNSAFAARAGASTVQYTTYDRKDYRVGTGYSGGVKTISLANVSDVNQNLTYRRNGVQQGAEVSGNGSVELGNTTFIGSRGAISGFTNGDIYGVVYRQGLFSADDAQSLEKYLADKSGVTL